MKIKNTKRLVKRAEGHLKADRFRQGFGYFGRLKETWHHMTGGAKRNKKNQWKGCAIGCLATPLSAAKFRDGLGQGNSLATLQEEFGISEWLGKKAENFFEHLPASSARTWPVRFSKALVPGSEPNYWECPDYDYDDPKDAKRFLKWLERQPVA